MITQMYKFNPSLESPEILQKSFVGRKDILFNILNKIDECRKGTSLRHFLIIGQRGMGKTHLLLLIYYSVKKIIIWDNEFADLESGWIPILFFEEEYRISNLSELLFRIIKEVEKESPELVVEYLPNSLATDKLSGRADIDTALGVLQNIRNKSGKRFLLLMDNLQEILRRFTEEDQGRLRDILMSKDLFLLVGTAPALFSKVSSYEQPFYQFFENIWLNGLNADDGANLIRQWVQFEYDNVAYEGSADRTRRINALVYLTGGNPRLILTLYLAIRNQKVIDVEQTFTSLLDDLTPYFQIIMNGLSVQQAKIMDTMALMSGPSSPTQISAKAGLDVRTVIPQLRRMEKLGYVKSLAERGKRSVRYDVSDFIFRMWRQMRVEAGRKYLDFLVTVIKNWYTKTELNSHVDQVIKHLNEAVDEKRNTEIERAVRQLWYLREACPSYLYTKISTARLDGLFDMKDYASIKKEIQVMLEKATKTNNAELRADAYWYNAKLLNFTNGELAEQRESLLSVIHIEPDNARAWYNLGITYLDENDNEKAFDAFKHAVEIDKNIAEAWYNLACDYSGRGEYEQAIAAYNKALEAKPNYYDAWSNLGAVYYILGKLDEAVEFGRKAIEIDPNRLEAWSVLGVSMARKNKFEEALEAFKKVNTIDSNLIDGYVWVAETQIRLDNYKLAVEACEKAVKVDPNYALCWDTLGHAYAHMEEYEKSIDAYGRAMQLDPQQLGPYLSRSGVLETIAKYDQAIEDLQHALNIAEQIKEKDAIAHVAEELVRINLDRSVDHINANEPIPAEKSLVESLKFASYLSFDSLQELIMTYFNSLLRRKQINFIKRAIEIGQASKIPELETLLNFYRVSLEYLETKNSSILNQLFPELRELIKSLDK